MITLFDVEFVHSCVNLDRQNVHAYMVAPPPNRTARVRHATFLNRVFCIALSSGNPQEHSTLFKCYSRRTGIEKHIFYEKCLS